MLIKGDAAEESVSSYRSRGGRGRWAGERHDFLDGQPKLQPMQRVADSYLPLDLCVRQRRHDGAALHVGAASGHVPGRHAHPQLSRGNRTYSRFIPGVLSSSQTRNEPPAKPRRSVRPTGRREGPACEPRPATRA